MARHAYPTGAIYVALAAPGTDRHAVLGSDNLFYVPDNRWGTARITEFIRDRYKSYTDRGYRILGYAPMTSNPDTPIRPLPVY